MDSWNWDEAPPQEVPPENRLSGLEGAELGFYFPEPALQGATLTADTRWKAGSTFLSLAGLPQLDWGSALPHPEAPWGHAPQALPWSGDWTELARTGSDPWSRVPQDLGHVPADLGPTPFAGLEGAAAARRLHHCVGRACGLGPPRLLGLGAARGLHHRLEGVPESRSHRSLRTQPAVGPRNFSSLPQNQPPR
uniref:ETS variant transcription factor 2 n=1 Tax=Equus asinus asinus TaxID=83772 RepID=A0A8C4PFC7_EQUAS